MASIQDYAINAIIMASISVVNAIVVKDILGAKVVGHTIKLMLKWKTYSNEQSMEGRKHWRMEAHS